MKKKILLVLSILAGLMFLNAGLNKFFNYMPMPENMHEDQMKMFTGMMAVVWLMPLIAVAEIAGGLLLITQRYRALGALILFPVLVGIVLTHLVIAPEGLPIALVLLAIIIWIMVEDRERFLPLVR